MEDLWTQGTYLNPNIFYIFNTQIIEYDIRSAGMNIAKDFNLIDNKTYEKLTHMNKSDRVKKLGLMQRSDPSFTSKLNDAFADVRRMFIETNNLDNSNIISIKKDAMFVTKECDDTNFLDHIEFRPKNTYTSYVRLNRKLELYYNTDVIDIKGMSDENKELHKDYMIKTINKFFSKMESEDPIHVIDYLRRFIDQYKRKELDTGYYRKFDSRSDFDLIDIPGDSFIFSPDIHKKYIDIQYNLMEVLIKLIKIPV